MQGEQIAVKFSRIFIYIHRAKEERNILQTVKQRKFNWVGRNWRRNCLLKYVIEGKIEGMIEGRRRRGMRRQQQDALQEKKTC